MGWVKHIRSLTLCLISAFVVAAFGMTAVALVGGQAVANAETTEECKAKVTEAKDKLAEKKRKQKEKIRELNKQGKKEKAAELKKGYEEEDAEAKLRIKEKSQKCKGKK
jgi:uncharacterized protein YlxW (UPF0749 family)